MQLVSCFGRAPSASLRPLAFPPSASGHLSSLSRLFALVLLAWLSVFAPPEAQAASTSLAVIGSDSIAGRAGESGSESYSGKVTDPPTKNSECTLNGKEEDSGPWSGAKWSWSAGSSDSSGVAVSLSPDPATSESVTLVLTYLKPGDYTVTVTGNVSYTSNCPSIDDSDTRTISVHVRGKKWDVGEDFTGGVATPGPMAPVEEGQNLGVSVSSASDSDHWVEDDQSGTDADTVTYKWSGSGRFDSPTSASSGWTAPDLGDKVRSQKFTLKCTIDDTPKAIGRYESGTRDDEALVAEVEVTVVQKVWDAQNSEGETGLSGNPVIVWQHSGVAVPDIFKVNVGSRLDLNLAGNVSDEDHWSKGEGESFSEGYEADELKYSWSGSDSSAFGRFSSPNAQATTWQAPASLLPGVDVLSIILTCTIDDTPKAITGKDGGNRGDSSLSRYIIVDIVQPKWSPSAQEIGYHPELTSTGAIKQPLNWLPNGRITAPIDQRVANPASEKAVLPGAVVACSVESAQDWDTFTDASGSSPQADGPLTYTWTASQGKFVVTHPDGSQTLESSATGTSASFKVPDGVSDGETIDIKCTLNDPTGARVGAGQTGSRDDDEVVRQVKVKVMATQVQFEGLARACAGGISVDGVHSFSISGIATRADGTIVPNADFKLLFEGNKGHDYTNDDQSLRPIGWTVDQIKRAKFVTLDSNGNQNLVEELSVKTDSQGRFDVTVLSSDIVSSDISIKVKSINPQGEEKDAGSQTCDFAEAISIRRFPNWIDLEEVEDAGWLFGQHWLNTDGDQTTAKIYMKFMVDPTLGDVDGNWKEVNGHRMLFEISDIDMTDDATLSTNFSEYATFAPIGENPAIYTTSPGPSGSSGGAATATVQAGLKIKEAQTIWISAYDQSQWDN